MCRVLCVEVYVLSLTCRVLCVKWVFYGCRVGVLCVEWGLCVEFYAGFMCRVWVLYVECRFYVSSGYFMCRVGLMC